MTCWKHVADWLLTGATVVLAIVAVFQDWIRAHVWRPRFRVSTKTAPPHCVKVSLNTLTGTFVADCFYLRVWVENKGSAPAKNVEVFASELLRRRADGKTEHVEAFPPMNLIWANWGQMYFPTISPDMGKHCDIGRIVDPARRAALHEYPPDPPIAANQVALAFSLITAPNHRGHIVGPGHYELKIVVAAENAKPANYTVTINLKGPWSADETVMLRDHVGISVRADAA